MNEIGPTKFRHKIIGEGTEIGALCDIAEGVEIGRDCRLKSFIVIHKGCKIGDRTRISHHVVIEENCLIGNDSFIGNGCILRPGTKIGNNCTVGHLTVFEGDSTIGDGTLIHAQCHITSGVKIGQKVFIAPFFCGANDLRISHARRDVIPFERKGYIIEDYVRIAIGVLVNPGITLGKNSLIRMGSVVTRDVPENAIVQGIPARIIGETQENERL